MNTISNSTLFNFLESFNILVIYYNPFYKSRLYGPISKVSDLAYKKVAWKMAQKLISSLSFSVGVSSAPLR